MDAILYGQEMARCGGVNLASRLYRYNTAPVSPSLLAALPNAQALEDHLGISGKDCLRPLLIEHWTQTTRWWKMEPWSGWVLRDDAARTGPPVYKLYISPTWQYLGQAMRLCLPILKDKNACAFKWGRGLTGVLRPDKFVIYFRDADSLHSAAASLLTKLGHLPAQGVPFTAEIGGAGLISWAKDPCASGDEAQSRISWRQLVCKCLADSLTAASSDTGNDRQPCEAALEHLREQGVDPISWTWCVAA